MPAVHHIPHSSVDLWSEEVMADPYPTFAALRDIGPIVRLDNSLLVLPRFAEVQEALNDWQTFSSSGGVAVDQDFNQSTSPNILASDPPEHTDFRRPMAGQLTIHRRSRR